MAEGVRLLVLRTGDPVAAVYHRFGTFSHLFARALGDVVVRPWAAGAGGPPAPGPVVLEHLDLEDVGHRADAPLPDLAGVHGVLVTGSPAFVGDRAPWMRFGMRLLEDVLARGVPLLGVCFGHQLLGAALGATVGPNPRGRQMGTIEVELQAAGDLLLGSMPARFRAQCTHRDVLLDPGPRLTVLGGAPHDPCHVVRAGPRAWGVQLHPEFDEDVMRAYIDARADQLDEAYGPGAAAERRAGVRPAPDAMRILPLFLDVCRLEARRAG